VNIAPPSQYPNLLDLGCGPGLYAERFCKAGYNVTGIDFSRRSIKYAKVQALLDNTDIEYPCMDYMSIDYSAQFDIITLIYCDYAVLSSTDRRELLRKVYRALTPGGKFIFDVFTHRMRVEESRTWLYSDQGGFYSDKPHLCLLSVHQYDDKDKTELRQSIIITDETVQCFNVWDHFFNKDELVGEVMPVGFSAYEIYSDVAGIEYSDSSETLCGMFTK
jgi:SAM-dependent methyltransferase